MLRTINVFLRLGKVTLSYQDMNTIKSIFIQAYKESMVAFIIFDTIIQIVQTDREKKRKEEIKYIIYSLDYQINFLEKYKYEDYQYIARFKIPVRTLLKKCRRKQKTLEKYIKKEGENAPTNRRMINEKNNIEKLTNNINEIINFSVVHTTKEYIDILTEVRILMYVLHIYED